MEDFINQLLQDQGVPVDLDPEVRQELFNELSEQAADFLNHRLLAAMSDEAVERFNALLEQDPEPTQVQEFIAANVPDKEQVATSALYEFRTVYLGDKA